MHYKKSRKDIEAGFNDAVSRGKPFLFIINFEMTEGYIIEDPLNQSDILFYINGITNNPAGASGKIKDYTICPHPLPPEEYKERFDVVSAALHRGDSFLTNLTIRTPIDINLTLSDIYAGSNTPYRILVPGRFVCFSPECFVKIRAGKISAYPMKGTIDASIPDAERRVLESFKEEAEHNTIVDLLRNDLSYNANNVTVKRFRYVDRIITSDREILQVSSEIEGTLVGTLPGKGDYHSRIGQIIFDMLPAGSVSGAPKDSTLRIIREAEQEERGFYTGVFGYFDGENLDSGVMIRFIEEEGEKYFFRSGGGITVNSDWREEYSEAIKKIYLPFNKSEHRFSEAICLIDGNFRNLELHAERMEKTISHFYPGISGKKGEGSPVDELFNLQVPAEYSKGKVKCRVEYSDKIVNVSYMPYHPKKIGSLALVRDDSIEYSFKSVDRNRLNELVNASGCDDIIIIKNGYVTDSSFSNLLFKDASGRLITPSDCLLEGTMRRYLLETGAIEERRITENEVKNFVNVRFINAMLSLEESSELDTSIIV